jgi:hypothetical protein
MIIIIIIIISSSSSSSSSIFNFNKNCAFHFDLSDWKLFGQKQESTF